MTRIVDVKSKALRQMAAGMTATIERMERRRQAQEMKAEVANAEIRDLDEIISNTKQMREFLNSEADFKDNPPEPEPDPKDPKINPSMSIEPTFVNKEVYDGKLY